MSSPNATSIPNGTTPPTQSDKNIFNMLFGPKTCVDYWANFWMYIAFAAVAAILFVIIAYVPMDRYMEGYIKNPNARLGVKALLFFFLMWLLVWLFAMWFQTHPTCTEK